MRLIRECGNLTKFNFDKDFPGVYETTAVNDATSTMLNTSVQRASKLMIINRISGVLS